MMTSRQQGRLEAIEKIKSFRIKLPESWKFDRDDANSRDSDEAIVSSDPEAGPSNPPRHS